MSAKLAESYLTNSFVHLFLYHLIWKVTQKFSPNCKQSINLFQFLPNRTNIESLKKWLKIQRT